MTRPDAAIPRDPDDPRALVEHKPQPAERKLLGCPNCGEVDLVFIEAATIERVVSAFGVGTSVPEVVELDEPTILDAPLPTPVGVRCPNCRWGFKGPNPLSRLVYASRGVADDRQAT